MEFYWIHFPYCRGVYRNIHFVPTFVSHYYENKKWSVMKCNHHLSVIHAKRIVRKKDLITATWYFRFYLFHSDCFKRQQVFISRFLPVNTLFNFFLIIYGLIFGSILMITEPSIIWLTFFFPIFYRFLSYYYVERFFSTERVDWPLGILKHSHSFSFNIFPM